MIAVNDDERRRALLAFIGAGWPTPPATALVVEALANARREVAARQARGEPIDDWLASQIRFGGIKEAAAFLATLETVDKREEVAQMCRHLHPDRQGLLDRLLAALDT